jgi:tripartite ATP-independent transporter DctM subunit
MITITGVLMLILFAAGMPVAFSIIIVSVFGLLIIGNVPLSVVPHRMIAGADSFPMMAIPFFLLAGSLMNTGGVTRRLVNFASALVGRMPGGLAHVNIVTNMIMAGMSGSALADAAGTGSILIPAMRQGGYPAAFSAVVTACASTIGPIIPPSIPFVVIGAMVGISIGRLFLGGAIPGTIMGSYLMIVAYIISKRRGYTPYTKSSLKDTLKAFREALLALLLPIIILGGILGGVFTPTEAAVVAAVYAFVLGVFVFKEIKAKDLPRIFLEAGMTTASLMFIVAAASVLGWLLSREQAGLKLVDAFLSISSNPWMVLFILNIILLILGCLMETYAIMIILVPVLMPLVKNLGIDPVHFGVVVVLNLCIGLVTPPFGMGMFLVCRLAGIKVMEFVKELPIFLIALLAALFTITFFPSLVTYLPRLLMG